VPEVGCGEENLNGLQYAILAELEAGGEAFITPTVLNVRVALRVCFANHATSSEDAESLLRSLSKIGDRISTGK
jgi:aromatic-L-amino-acid decarboxylase